MRTQDIQALRRSPPSTSTTFSTDRHNPSRDTHSLHTLHLNMPVKRLAVLTSGGDSSGMNPAIRAVVRSALARQADVFAIFEGYQGLVEGGNKIRAVDWSFVSGIMNKV